MLKQMHGLTQKMKFQSKQFQQSARFVLYSPRCARTVAIVPNAGETSTETIADRGRYNKDLDARFKVCGRVTTSRQRVRENVMVRWVKITLRGL